MTTPVFVSPAQNIDILHRKHLAQIKMRENTERRQLNITSQECEEIAAKYEKERKCLLVEKQNLLTKVARICKIVGSGCECGNTTQKFPEFEKVLHPYLIDSVASIIVEYTGPPLIELSAEQKYVIQIIAAGQNVFFTGRAGTGKSLILSALRKLHIEGVEFTAMTGIAAINISGMTLHSFCGIGKGDGDVKDWIKQVRSNKDCRNRWNMCQCLVIDEVSMLSATLFEKIEELARCIRRNDKPFGGIALICVGDFFQLSPVEQVRKAQTYCFESPVWKTCFQPENCLELSRIYRQSDIVFTDLLDDVRKGNISQKSLELLQYLKRPLCEHQNILATKLKCLNVDVDRTNREHLLALKQPVFGYRATDTGKEPYLTKLLKSCNAETQLDLCVGAQVMLLRKLPNCKHLTNGSRGVVTKFEGGGFPVVQFINMDHEILVQNSSWASTLYTKKKGRIILAARAQIPLRLAFATSIHKSQGLTLNKVSVNLKGVFAHGQGYVALSRATSLKTLQVVDFDERKSFQTSGVCIEFMKTLTPITDAMMQIIANPSPLWDCPELQSLQFFQDEEEPENNELGNSDEDDDDDDVIIIEKTKRQKNG